MALVDLDVIPTVANGRLMSPVDSSALENVWGMLDNKSRTTVVESSDQSHGPKFISRKRKLLTDSDEDGCERRKRVRFAEISTCRIMTPLVGIKNKEFQQPESESNSDDEDFDVDQFDGAFDDGEFDDADDDDEFEQADQADQAAETAGANGDSDGNILSVSTTMNVNSADSPLLPGSKQLLCDEKLCCGDSSEDEEDSDFSAIRSDNVELEDCEVPTKSEDGPSLATMAAQALILEAVERGGLGCTQVLEVLRSLLPSPRSGCRRRVCAVADADNRHGIPKGQTEHSDEGAKRCQRQASQEVSGSECSESDEDNDMDDASEFEDNAREYEESLERVRLKAMERLERVRERVAGGGQAALLPSTLVVDGNMQPLLEILLAAIEAASPSARSTAQITATESECVSQCKMLEHEEKSEADDVEESSGEEEKSSGED